MYLHLAFVVLLNCTTKLRGYTLYQYDQTLLFTFSKYTEIGLFCHFDSEKIVVLTT